METKAPFPSVDPAGVRALIVEDDVILGWALGRALYDAGFGAVKIAASVGEVATKSSFRHRMPLIMTSSPAHR